MFLHLESEKKRNSKSPIEVSLTKSVETQTSSVEVVSVVAETKKVNSAPKLESLIELERLRDELKKANETIVKLKEENEK